MTRDRPEPRGASGQAPTPWMIPRVSGPIDTPQLPTPLRGVGRYDHLMPPRARTALQALEPDWSALAAAALERAQSAPVPTSYKAEWFPASVRLPDLRQPVRLAKVYATRTGLYVYVARPTAPASEVRRTGGVPFWWAPVQYDKTPRPPTGYAAQRSGIQLVTDVGTVTVQPLGHCGCSNQHLKHWRPEWASRNEAWEAV